MVKSSRVWRWRLAAEAFPSVKADIVMIPPGRDKCSLVAHTNHQFESEHAAVEAERPIKVSHFQVHMTNAYTRTDRLVARFWIVRRGHCSDVQFEFGSQEANSNGLCIWSEKKRDLQHTGFVLVVFLVLDDEEENEDVYD